MHTDLLPTLYTLGARLATSTTGVASIDLTPFTPDKFDALTANSHPAYRDKWALRSTRLGVAYDCWKEKARFVHGDCFEHSIVIESGAKPIVVSAGISWRDSGWEFAMLPSRASRVVFVERVTCASERAAQSFSIGCAHECDARERVHVTTHVVGPVGFQWDRNLPCPPPDLACSALSVRGQRVATRRISVRARTIPQVPRRSRPHHRDPAFDACLLLPSES